MAYKCLECGKIFDDSEKWKEDRGEYWGYDSSEDFEGCPFCRGQYEEMTKCNICGNEFLEEELNGGVCIDCINEYRKDFDMCYNISLGETEKIEINSLLISLFDPEGIEQILKDHIKNKWDEIDCSKFIDSDLSWFGENLSKEVKNNECEKK